ncbi:hypothetical protein TTHERM_00497350 (macronuclear) [Tetrahymena thermophila SB210]|uniref:Uncharacterized protein n=1 Tax=Tetrahymena thermophila (strain SB210) TaxID=312017 RepID=I7MJZ4_TETTS|nr:hypothetical protein TTHERM_00497350 [Tetrahymena thermophila SB210]EAS07682.2 hypothetical protein TTHERM_00497350 [Tetrahymena thermophila SB210]|eukprot:XP_001027924.2 hypothetical protein TTHERM_00497350 [Tetrahymena thermophila SB210]
MEYCEIHPDLQYIYILLNPSQNNLFKCAQCVIDEDIENTKQLILINKILQCDDKTMFMNWPPNDSCQKLQKIMNLINKNQDGNFKLIKSSIQDNFKQLKSDLIDILNKEENKLISIIDTNINYLIQFQNQYNILAEKEKFKSIVTHSLANRNSQFQNLSNFIHQKQQQLQEVSQNMFRIYPKALLEFDEYKLKQAFNLIKDQIQQQIKTLDELVFNLKEAPEVKINQYQKQLYSSQENQEFLQSNYTQNNSMEAILQIFNQKTNFQDLNQTLQTQIDDKNNEKKQTDKQNLLFDLQQVTDIFSDRSSKNCKIQNQNYSFSSQENSNLKTDVTLNKNDQTNLILNGEISLLKSQKGGAETDLEIGQNEQGFPFVRYKLSGYDHSQCYLNKIIKYDKKYLIRVNIGINDPINDQFIIGLIKQTNVHKIYIHQEKVCFGNSQFSSTSAVQKGGLLQTQSNLIKQLEFEIQIQSGSFIVRDYPNYDYCNSLQNSTFLKDQSHQNTDWLLGFFFFSGFEQINNNIIVTYFAES